MSAISSSTSQPTIVTGQQLGRISTWHNKTVEQMSDWTCCGWVAKLEVTPSSSYVETMFKVAALSLATISLFVFDTATSLLEYVFCCKKNEEEDPNKSVPFTLAQKNFLDELMVKTTTERAAEQKLRADFEKVAADPAAFKILVDITKGCKDDRDKSAALFAFMAEQANEIEALKRALGVTLDDAAVHFLEYLSDMPDLVARIVPASSSTATPVEDAFC